MSWRAPTPGEHQRDAWLAWAEEELAQICVRCGAPATRVVHMGRSGSYAACERCDL